MPHDTAAEKLGYKINIIEHKLILKAFILPFIFKEKAGIHLWDGRIPFLPFPSKFSKNISLVLHFICLFLCYECIKAIQIKEKELSYS